MSQRLNKNIFFVGGGTAGPTMPLLAIAEKLPAGFVVRYILSDSAFDRKLASDYRLEAFFVKTAKLRRYFDLKNFLEPFIFLFSLVAIFKIFRKTKPAVVVAAGSFVEVPVILMAKIFKAKILIHQQDVVIGLANRLSLVFADIVTCSLLPSYQKLQEKLFVVNISEKNKVKLLGNPTKASILNIDKKTAYVKFGLDDKYPTLLVLGGGTGSLIINTYIKNSIKELTASFNIIHLTGGKNLIATPIERYYPFDYLNDIEYAYGAADVVVARSGMSTLSELSKLSKMSVLIPISQSHQEHNAWYAENFGAAIVVEESELASIDLVRMVKYLLLKKDLLDSYKKKMRLLMPHNASEKISEEVIKLYDRYKQGK